MTEPETTETEALERAESDAAAEAAAVAPPAPDAPDAPDAREAPDAPDAPDHGDDALTSNDYSVAFSPRQVAVGLAIVAGLVAVAAARRHRKRTGPDA